MKGDFTRFTHDPSKHYSGVLEQQGRVALEADRNEAFEIQAYLEQTTKRNVIGLCGVPINNGGFRIGITPDRSDLTIAPGRIYVDGILVELDKSKDEITYTMQPDYPDPPALLPPVEGRTDLVYLDVWQRHVTAVEDPDIREVALPVPDTTTRLQTLGQVKVLPNVDKIGCDDSIARWDSLVKPSGGRLTTEVDVRPAAENPCFPALDGGYRGLENRLYRVEIHTGSDSGTPAFKWSRDNGSVVLAIEKISQNEGNKVKLKRLGRDQVLTVHVGDWVEVLGDETEKNGQHGTLARIVENGIDEVERVLTLSKDVSIHAGEGHPKVRRWDQQSDAVTVTTDPGSDPITLEEGIAVRFSGDDFRTGDYWTFAARAATGTTGTVEILTSAPPQGTQHHYCRLALVTWSRKDGKLIGNVRDCRKLFPPLTELSPLYYVGGDGQEAMPDLMQPQQLVALAAPLEVGVANRVGAKIRFEITKGNGRLQGTGSSVDVLTRRVDVLTRTDGIARLGGIASCSWELDPSTHSQQVEAYLLDEADNPIPLPVPLPVRFTANLSVAMQVGYDPGGCGKLLGPPANNVQTALERLSKLSSLYYVSGNAQEIMPADMANLTRFKPLRVLVANKCGPVGSATVKFEITEGGGRLNQVSGPVQVNTNSQGIAECGWVLGTAATEPATQRVMATLISAPGDATHPNPIHEPLGVEFVANLSVASEVAYTPPEDCPPLAQTKTVEQALNALCKPDSGGGCSVTVGDGGQYESLTDALEALKGQDDVCITLLPGDHKPPDAGTIDNHRHVELIGCTPGGRMVLDRPLHFESLASCTLRDLEIKAGLKKPVGEPLVFRQCDEVILESCYLSGVIPAGGVLLRIAGGDRIQLRHNRIEALPPELDQDSMQSPLVVFAGVDGEIAALFDESLYGGRFDRITFELRALEVARSLSQRGPEDRSNFAKGTRVQVDSLRAQLDLDIEEQESYERFAQGLESDIPEPNIPPNARLLPDRLLRCLVGIRDAASPLSPCPAVVIEAANPSGEIPSGEGIVAIILADTILENNNIVGAVSLYGVPGETEVAGKLLDTKVLTRLGEKIKRTDLQKITISEAFGTLHVLNNKLTRLVVAKDMLAEIREKALFSQSSEQIVGVYGRSFITNNVFAGEGNVLLAYHQSLNSNAFNLGAGREESDAAKHKVIGDSVILIGNYAPQPDILWNVSRVNQKSANLTLDIIDL